MEAAFPATGNLLAGCLSVVSLLVRLNCGLANATQLLKMQLETLLDDFSPTITV